MDQRRINGDLRCCFLHIASSTTSPRNHFVPSNYNKVARFPFLSRLARSLAMAAELLSSDT